MEDVMMVHFESIQYIHRHHRHDIVAIEHIVVSVCESGTRDFHGRKWNKTKPAPNHFILIFYIFGNI